MNCHLCKQPVTYIGFLKIECGSKGCENWDKVERRDPDDGLVDYDWYSMCCRLNNVEPAYPDQETMSHYQAITGGASTRREFKNTIRGFYPSYRFPE